MSKISKYYINSVSSADVSVELGVDYGDINLNSEHITVFGSSLADTIYVNGLFDADFTELRSGSDIIYLGESWQDYARSWLSGTSIYEFVSVNNSQSIRFSRGSSVVSDSLVLEDGSITTFQAAVNLEIDAPQLGTKSYGQYVSPKPENNSGVVVGYAIGDEGSTFASLGEQLKLNVFGTGFVDTFYLQEGHSLEIDSRSGTDLVYLRGNWIDYSKDVSGSTLTLSRTVGGSNEFVSLSFGSASATDRLIFADGAIPAFWAVVNASASDFSSVEQYIAPNLDDQTTYTPLTSVNTEGPIVVSFTSPQESGAYIAGDVLTINATLDEEVVANSQIQVTLDTGAKLILQNSANSTILSGSYTIGPAEVSADLQVISLEVISVVGVSGQIMNSTDLPQGSNNLAGSKDFAINSSVLVSDLHNMSNLDVRSDIVVKASVELDFTSSTGVYQIALVNAEQTGFQGENVTSNQTITVEVNQNGEASWSGGNLTFQEGQLVIDPFEDLDLGNSYELIISEGLLVDKTTGNPLSAVSAGEISFSTVSPTAEGSVSTIYLSSNRSYASGGYWYDGSGGSLVDNSLGLDLDLGDKASVVVLGQLVSHESQILFNKSFYTNLKNWGGDDFVYIDKTYGSQAGVIDTNNVQVIGNADGGGSIFFSAIEGLSGLTFFSEDDALTSVNEANLSIEGFVDSELNNLIGGQSFESVYGSDFQPIIVG